MSITAGAAALMGTTLSVGGGMLQNQANRQEAARQRHWNEQMMLKQNKWNKRMWELTNMYNSPIEQMARLKAAGLNPHLMYGQGNVGQADPLKSADVKGYTRPQMENVLRGVNTFTEYQNFKMLQAQTNNAEKQSLLLEQEAKVKAQQAVNLAIRGKREGLKFGYDKTLLDYQVSFAEENLRSLEYDNQYKERTMNDRVKKAAADLAVSIASEKQKNINYDLEKLKLEMRKQGIEVGDHFLTRQLYNRIRDPQTKAIAIDAIVNHFGLNKEVFLKLLNQKF